MFETHDLIDVVLKVKGQEIKTLSAIITTASTIAATMLDLWEM